MVIGVKQCAKRVLAWEGIGVVKCLWGARVLAGA